MTAIDRTHDYAADVRAAFERLLTETRSRLEEVTHERDAIQRALVASRAECERLRAQLDSEREAEQADREYDERNADLPGRAGYTVTP